jgi:murein DD-endopeptidase MepM/ murein hydrolase activator NlpD
VELGGPPHWACLSERSVAGFLEDCLSSEQRANVEVHIDGCASCRRLIIELVSTLSVSSIRAEMHTTHPVQVVRDDRLVKGTVVGRFVVLGLVGAGGMGVVYTAYDPDLDRRVALKLLHPGVHEGSNAHAHLLTEARMMARISHANVIAIFDVGTYREQVFAAMELVCGTTLRKWMEARSHGWREVIDVFLHAGEGLAAAHAAGVVHRDFKPENVLLGGDGRIKVSDFGLATLTLGSAVHRAGTPGYVAVEGCRTGGVDQRGDQFSFCVTLHEALHGCRPFSATGLDELVVEVQRGPAPDAANRTVPSRLNSIVRRGLSLAPEDRYPSMQALLADIRRMLAARRMRRFGVAVVGALALVMGVTAVLVGTRNAAKAPPCASAPALLTGVWDRTRREDVKAALLRQTTPAAVASFESTVATLDRYALLWTATWTEACEATEVRREQPAMLHDLRMACLDRARISLRNLVETLTRVDVGEAVEAAAAAAALPPLEVCSDGDALRASVPSPLGQAARAQIQTSTSAIDEAGDVESSKIEADPILSRPDFRLPFGCGESWELSHKQRFPHVDRRVVFSLPANRPSAGFAVFASAPGWVSQVNIDSGDLAINHGAGWHTTYRHMTDIRVAQHQYIGRGHVIGRVGNVNVQSPIGGPGPAYLSYEQVYRPGAPSVAFDGDRGPDTIPLFLDWEVLDLHVTGPQIRTSTNNCLGGGTPGGAAPFDVPISSTVFSRSQPTVEIMTRRAEDHALFERWYRRGWNGAPMQHTIVGQPAVAVFEGKIHVIARRSDGSLFDLHYGPFTGWNATPLAGRVAGDPEVAVYGWDRNLHVVARGPDGFLYRWYTAVDGSWTSPVRVGNIDVIGTPALFSHYDTLYIVARSRDDALWSWETDRRRGSRVRRLRGAAADHPDIAVDPRSGLVNVVARGPDDRIYRWEARDPDGAHASGPGWSEPQVIDAERRVAGAPAAIVYKGAMHVFARDSSGAVHHWWKEATWQWEAAPGAYASDPDVLQFGDQLQTIGRAPGRNLQTIWYDPTFGVWHVENQDVDVSG